jgi:hypothetical protein
LKGTNTIETFNYYIITTIIWWGMLQGHLFSRHIPIHNRHNPYRQLPISPCLSITDYAIETMSRAAYPVTDWSIIQITT